MSSTPNAARHRSGGRLARAALTIVAIVGAVGSLLVPSPPSVAGADEVAVSSPESTSPPTPAPSPTPEGSSSVEYLDGATPVTSRAGFVHPGVLVDLPALEFVRRQVAADAEPWASIFRSVRSSSVVRVSFDRSIYADARDVTEPCTPRSPQGCVLDCVADNCRETLRDQSLSAYGNALLWYYSGNAIYAQRSVAMLNEFSRTVVGFVANMDTTQQGTLLAGWTAQMLVRAAEIMRYTYTPSRGEPAFDVADFTAFVEGALLPHLGRHAVNAKGAVNNWRTSAIEGLMNSAIFLDDRGLFDEAVQMWRDLVPSYIYLAEDGDRPLPFPDGLHPDEAAQACMWTYGYAASCQKDTPTAPEVTYQNGQSLEACRDYWHAGAGLGGLINAAETARLQGVDLYGEQSKRLMSATSYLLQIAAMFPSWGYPSGFCGKAALNGDSRWNGSTLPAEAGGTSTLADVVAYNHYATREGRTFPSLDIPGYPEFGETPDPVASYIKRNQSGPRDGATWVTAWQSLTHWGVGTGVGEAPPSPSTSPSATPSPEPTKNAPSALLREPVEGPSVVFLSGIVSVVALVVAFIGTIWWAIVRRRRTRTESGPSDTYG